MALHEYPSPASEAPRLPTGNVLVAMSLAIVPVIDGSCRAFVTMFTTPLQVQRVLCQSTPQLVFHWPLRRDRVAHHIPLPTTVSNPHPWPPPWRIIEHSMSCQIKEYVMTSPLYCPKMMMSLQATWHDLTQDSFHHSIPLVPDHSQGLHHLKGVNMEQPNWLLQRKPILYLLLFF